MRQMGRSHRCETPQAAPSSTFLVAAGLLLGEQSIPVFLACSTLGWLSLRNESHEAAPIAVNVLCHEGKGWRGNVCKRGGLVVKLAEVGGSDSYCFEHVSLCQSCGACDTKWLQLHSLAF